MPISSTSHENSNAAAILVSTENIYDDDEEEEREEEEEEEEEKDEEEEENSNDLLDQESIRLMPMPSTSQGNNNASVILISIENVDGDDDEEEKNSSGFRDEERMELLPIPSTSQRNSRASAILKATENDDDDEEEEEEEDSFTTQQLFSFAWQIARGMVGITIAISRMMLSVKILPSSDSRPPQENFPNEPSECPRWVLHALFIDNLKLP